jgi:hypothetical protein
MQPQGLLEKPLDYLDSADVLLRIKVAIGTWRDDNLMSCLTTKHSLLLVCQTRIAQIV